MQPKIGLTGIEPITFRYERNILPLNYRIIKYTKIKIAKKSYIKIQKISTRKRFVTKFNFAPIKVIIYDCLKKHKNYFLAYTLSAIIKFIRSYSTMPLTVQSIYQWYTFLNPLVQKKHFFSFY